MEVSSLLVNVRGIMEMENQYLVTIIVIDSGEIINRYLDW